MPKTANHECAICLKEVFGISRARTLQCGHTFHDKCIGKWLQRKQTCPICRRTVPKPPMEDPRIAFMFRLLEETK